MLNNNNTKFQLDLNHFKLSYSKSYPNTNIPDTNFLEWFIGFTEGIDNSCFTINNSKVNNHPYPNFIITQSTNNIQILYYIQNKLGFGKVIKKGNNISQYIVINNKDISIFANLFNGNIVLPKTFNKYSLWIKCYNNNSKSYYNSKILINNSIITPKFNNYWICGFTDSKGHFKCSIINNSKAYRYQFILVQKGIENIPSLIAIRKVLGGKVISYPAKNVYQLIINGTLNIKNVINYFDQHNLLTKKKKSYKIWKDIGIDILNKKHLVSTSRKELKAISKQINQ